MTRWLVLSMLVGCSLDAVEFESLRLGPEPPMDGSRTDAAHGPDLGCLQPEVCDGVDNNCDDAIDEGFDLAVDVSNCGRCGAVCEPLPNAFPRCEGGRCVLGACFEIAGCRDLDGDPSNGCEYCCLVSDDGVETCDGIDNDCDGQIDEDWDLLGDENNCGACGTVCERTCADQVSCIDGGCIVTSCTAGCFDCDLASADGCEYRCVETNGGVETCDGVDNDCDCLADEGTPAGAPCGTDEGECQSGTYQCFGGDLVCSGGRDAEVERCDGLDNDCDAATDEDFDFQNNPATCGGCAPCSMPFAYEGCSNGICVVVDCEPGHVNLDGDPTDADGCEYACSTTGAEICDGVDNDCNGLTDTDDPAMLTLQQNICRVSGPCAPCMGAPGDPAPCAECLNGAWCCIYAPEVETTPSCAVVAEETRCDGADNDCDGDTDESYPLGEPCISGEDLGACADTGTWECDAGTPDPSDITCGITDLGVPAAAEACDGIDNDCDGETDETADGPVFPGVQDSLVLVAAADPDLYVYRHEASRPDATAATAGTSGARACSKAGVLPWASVTWDQASAACTAAGMRLCTEADWETACSPTGLRYPYGDTYDAAACNGNDYDPDGGTPQDQDYAVPTGSLGACETPGGIFDMSGNLKEWTGSLRAPGPPPAYAVRGGAYDTPPGGLTCGFDFVVAESTLLFPNLGFRCCCSASALGCPP